MSAANEAPTYRLPEKGVWANAWKISAVVGAVGLGLLALGYSSDPHRFAFSYLYGLFTILTLALGAMFFVVTMHVTKGYWAVTMRRIPEVLMVCVPVLALLFVPVALHAETLYEWVGGHHDDAGEGHGDDADDHGADDGHGVDDGHGHEHGALLGASVVHAQGHGAGAEAAPHHTPMEEALHHRLMEHKSGYLNYGGWLGRSAAYWLIWILIAVGYFRLSTRQDKSKDFALTNRMESFAPISAMAFGVTLTFAAFDWVMAMEPTWYSTIFGVHVFAGAACVVLATMIVVLMSLADAGYLGKAVNVEHFHDLGKLLFGFMCFWAYVGFSQWMLIYYAGIPEEATYFERRWGGGWEMIAYILIFGHFVAPFLFFMSRIVKRNLPLLKATAIWLIVMHAVDMYWYVMPYATDGQPNLTIHPMDIGALLFVGGAFFTAVFLVMKRVNLIPVGDPRLSRGLHHVQSH